MRIHSRTGDPNLYFVSSQYAYHSLYGETCSEAQPSHVKFLDQNQIVRTVALQGNYIRGKEFSFQGSLVGPLCS